MPRVNLTWYAPIVRRVMKDVCALKQREIAEIEGVTRQAVSKKMISNTYEEDLTNWVQILDKAGYEIREKTDEGNKSNMLHGGLRSAT